MDTLERPKKKKKVLWAKSHWKAPNFCEFYLQELYQVLRVKLREHPPHAVGKAAVLRRARSTPSYSRGLPSRETTLPEANHLRAYQSLTQPSYSSEVKEE